MLLHPLQHQQTELQRGFARNLQRLEREDALALLEVERPHGDRLKIFYIGFHALNAIIFLPARRHIMRLAECHRRGTGVTGRFPFLVSIALAIRKLHARAFIALG